MRSFRRCLVGVFVYIAKQPSTCQPLCRKDQRVHVIITAVRGWGVQEPDSVDSTLDTRVRTPRRSLLSALLLSAIFILSDLSLLHEQLTNHRHRERRELGGLCRSVGGLLTSSRLHSAQGFSLQLLRLLSRAVAKTQEPSSIFRYFQ